MLQKMENFWRICLSLMGQ